MHDIYRGHHHDHMVDLDTGKVIEFSSEEIEALLDHLSVRATPFFTGHPAIQNG